MSWNQGIRAAKIGYIIVSVTLCILGLVLIGVPDFSAVLLCRIGGILMILFGVAKILGYCSKDLYRLAFQYDLAFGILVIALGIGMLFRTNPAIHVLCAILGIYVLADALLKIQIAIDAKTFGLKKWWLIFSSAILTGIVGFLLIFRPFESAHAIMILLGITLLMEGILNLITILTAVKIVQKQFPSVIDEPEDAWEEVD